MKLIDAFPINDEMDVLRVRLDLLDGLVERVLIAEGSHTHQGRPKPMALDGVKLPPQAERIRCDLSGHPHTDDGNWTREGLQREYLLLRLEALFDSGEADPETLVISSDADELVDPLSLPRIIQATEQGPVLLHMRMIFYGSWELPQGWYHAKAFRLKDLPDSLTQLRLRFDLPSVEDAGWHVSYRGEEADLQRKLEAFAHGENMEPERWARIRTGKQTGRGPNGEELVPLRELPPIPVRDLLR